VFSETKRDSTFTKGLQLWDIILNLFSIHYTISSGIVLDNTKTIPELQLSTITVILSTMGSCGSKHCSHHPSLNEDNDGSNPATAAQRRVYRSSDEKNQRNKDPAELAECDEQPPPPPPPTTTTTTTLGRQEPLATVASPPIDQDVSPRTLRIQCRRRIHRRIEEAKAKVQQEIARLQQQQQQYHHHQQANSSSESNRNRTGLCTLNSRRSNGSTGQSTTQADTGKSSDAVEEAPPAPQAKCNEPRVVVEQSHQSIPQTSLEIDKDAPPVTVEIMEVSYATEKPNDDTNDLVSGQADGVFGATQPEATISWRRKPTQRRNVAEVAEPPRSPGMDHTDKTEEETDSYPHDAAGDFSDSTITNDSLQKIDGHPGPLSFHDIQNVELRRVAHKLYKRLNHDPWDRFKKFNDGEVLNFLEEHPETAAIQYDFEFFSGHLFPLSVLCALGASSLSTIQRAYHAFPPALDECDPWIGTPLHYACAHKAKSSVVSFLMDQRPDMLRAKNQFERTPLHMACLFKASSKIVALLLEKDPTLADAVEKDGYTPLHLACENGSSADVVKLLIASKPERCLAVTHKDSSTPLHLACGYHANLAVIGELLQASPEALGTLDAHGLTPLHIAVKQHASSAVIGLLIRANPECVDMTTGKGYSVLSLAKHSNSPEEVLQLLMVS
jgi:Ankyrin repeats (3 copies)/Ankyrin repeats (many copies)/Ankyrin repeat